MYKKLSISITISEILLLIGTYLVQYFSKTRMGMARHVIFKNQQWEKAFSISTMKHVAISLFIILLILLLLKYFKKSNRLNLYEQIRIVITFTVTVISSIFILIGSPNNLISFYYISQILFIVVLLDLIHSYFIILGQKNCV